MSPSDRPYHVAVTAEDPNSLDHALNRAVEEAIAHALGDGSRGILVTRHTPRSYTVELSRNVPFGTTIEADITADDSPVHAEANRGALR